MELKGGLPKFYIPQVKISIDMLKIITPYAVVAALVGLTEAVLTLRVIDEMTDTRGRTNKECIAQGLAKAVNSIAEKYENVGKTMTLIRLSEDCNRLFENAKSITCANIDSSTIIAGQYKA